MITRIDSATNKKVVEAAKLKQNKYRTESNQFLVEGFHLLEMAIKNDSVTCIFTEKELDIDEKYIQYLVPRSIIEKISSLKEPQSVLTICNMVENKYKTSSKLVYLDGIQDPGNLGTILRTCLAFGITNVALSEDCVSIYNSKTVSASQGAIFEVNTCIQKREYLTELKKEGFQIIATSLEEKSVFLHEFKPTSEKMVIIFGNEGNGISEYVKKIASDFVKIKISNIDSLNVSIAAGIVLNSLIN